MKKIFASNDPTKFALIDDDVFETIQEMNLKFCIQPNGYFRSATEIKLTGMTKKKRLYLHRFIWILKTKTEPAISVDHADIDKLNNQFENLRLATRKEQQHNKWKMKNNTSGYIGVSYQHDKRGNGYDYWLASIMRPDGRRETKYSPYTDEGKIAAACWYDTKAIKYSENSTENSISHCHDVTEEIQTILAPLEILNQLKDA